ncbi:TMAO reductase system periplasmic protein TorT [Photobacterium sp. MCCC 1A19761]|uniref:TMAO reductase system periplasmic protein TorT n=1 Tax=Photobacterium sp. MCCC 1A19761 TaxID=3115000 RepID=UPI00307D2E24
MTKRPLFSLFFSLLSFSASAEVWVEANRPPFHEPRQPQQIHYQPLTQASKPWKLCAVYPHLKDSYWLSVNYGMVRHARQLGVQLKVLEAGGYPNLTHQQAQLQQCRQWQADAIILGAVDRRAYAGQLSQLVADIPVFATINDLDMTDSDLHRQVVGKVGVDWSKMGQAAGEFLAKRHPAGSGIVNIAWLPGPKWRGGTHPVNQGFRQAIQGSDVRIVATLWADNSKELQRNLIQQLFAERQDIDYIVGGAVAAEVAISELRSMDQLKEIGIVSTYLSHGVYRGLLRGRVLFAPTDKMAQQAMLSVDQAVRYLDKRPVERDLATIIEPLTPDHLPAQVISDSLSPAEFRPTFRISPTTHSRP